MRCGNMTRMGRREILNWEGDWDKKKANWRGLPTCNFWARLILLPTVILHALLVLVSIVSYNLKVLTLTLDRCFAIKWPLLYHRFKKWLFAFLLVAIAGAYSMNALCFFMELPLDMDKGWVWRVLNIISLFNLCFNCSDEMWHGDLFAGQIPGLAQ